MRYLLVCMVALGGCAMLPKPGEVAIVEPAPPAVKPALINECKGKLVSGTPVKRAQEANSTTAEAEEQALIANAKKLKWLSTSSVRCFCYLAENQLVSGVDPKDVARLCSSVKKKEKIS